MATLESRERAAEQNGGTTGDQIPVENPATGQIIGHVPDLGADEVKRLVDEARAAQPAWAAMGFDARRKVFLRARKWLVASVAGTVFVLALVLTLLMTPIFRASSTLQIERDAIKVVNVEGLTPAESPMDRDFYQTQYELLQSRSLALRVIQDQRPTE